MDRIRIISFYPIALSATGLNWSKTYALASLEKGGGGEGKRQK